jgi:phytoene dehydrogenase-like protein
LHKGYRFDAGATLAGGFYPGGPLDLVAQNVGIQRWPARADEAAMAVHLPDGTSVTRWGDERRWQERARAFGAASLDFWRWQERTADALWDLALTTPSWPPQSASEGLDLLGKGVRWLADDVRRRLHPTIFADAFRPVAAHLQDAPATLRTFVDAQLLIAAQTGSAQANALYGASALDLPRRGIMHLEGGIGTIAATLASALVSNGGRIHYRRQATSIRIEKGRPVAVRTNRGEDIPADIVICNLPPWNIVDLLGENRPPSLRKLPERPTSGWGAFMVYVGLDDSAIPDDVPLHSQVVVREPMGEGNTVFLSLSPTWDGARAPAGRRALTISTHTETGPWWSLYETDRRRYDLRKQAYVDRILAAAEQVLPGLRDGAELILPGTPVTFQRFTRRKWGWVGGFPQINLFRAWPPRLAPHLWMVGDSIFPGQSTAAVALGGMRVADSILNRLDSRDVTTTAYKSLNPQIISVD